MKVYVTCFVNHNEEYVATNVFRTEDEAMEYLESDLNDHYNESEFFCDHLDDDDIKEIINDMKQTISKEGEWEDENDNTIYSLFIKDI